MKWCLLEHFILLLCLTSMGFCAPTSWQVNQLNVHEDIIQRKERDISEGYGSGEGPCSDDEDSPCYGGLTSTTQHPKPHTVSLGVESSITARYVSTTVVTKMKNQAPTSQDSNFHFRLTEDAFISDFFMVIEGETYQAEVQEKEAAQKAYNEARQRGQTAGQIKQSDNDFTKFETNINLSPNTTATFHLTFQELLRRNNGVFQHRINLSPREIVQHLRADVYITEPQGISFANITWEQDYKLTTDFFYDPLSVEYKSDKRVHAQFNPSAVDQEELSETGLEGDLVITYDVVHDSGAGHIEVLNGYFVHHISPVGIPVTRKDVVFVIDVSGSMQGSKMAQTKLALSAIIEEIRDFDRFNIISFSTSTRYWKENLVKASGQNKDEAKSFVDGLVAAGGTNIYAGVMGAVHKLQEVAISGTEEAFPMIVLLTDGQPTSGVTSTTELVQLTTDAIQGKIALFSLAFGEEADYTLLEKLSGNNNGLARRIYHDSNPSLQLEGFYKEVATPLLFNVQVMYNETAVEMDSLTVTKFICYFEGKELVIAGKLREDFTGNEISAVVSGNSFDVSVEWGLTKEIETEEDSKGNTILKGHVVDDFAQRLWAFVTIKDLISKSHVTIDEDEKTTFRDRALTLALKYKFVTPLTSLIVIKPDNDENDNEVLITEEEPIEEDYYNPILSFDLPVFPSQYSIVFYAFDASQYSIPSEPFQYSISYWSSLAPITCDDQPCFPGAECEVVSIPDLNDAALLTTRDIIVLYQCGPCPPGYLGDGEICEDINECEIEPPITNCHVNADCENKPGAYVCLCSDGFFGNGTHCSRLDPHTCDDDPCSPVAECIPIDPDDLYFLLPFVQLFKCGQCPEEYEGDGYNCTLKAVEVEPPFVNLTVLVMAADPTDGDPLLSSTFVRTFVSDPNSESGTRDHRRARTAENGIAVVECPHNQSIIVTANDGEYFANSVSFRCNIGQTNVVTLPLHKPYEDTIYVYHPESPRRFGYGNENLNERYSTYFQSDSFNIPDNRRVQLLIRSINVSVASELELVPEMIACLPTPTQQRSRGDVGAPPPVDDDVDIMAIEAFGALELTVTDLVTRRSPQFKPGKKMVLKFPIQKLPDDLEVGDKVPAWTFKFGSGCWEQDGEGELVIDQTTGNLVWRYEANHFSWWAAGRVNQRTSCVNVRTCYDETCNHPAKDTLIRIFGKDYGFETFRYTDDEGETCIQFPFGRTIELSSPCTNEAIEVESTENPSSCPDGRSEIPKVPTYQMDETQDSCREAVLVISEYARSCPQPEENHNNMILDRGMIRETYPYTDVVSYSCSEQEEQIATRGLGNRVCTRCYSWTGNLTCDS